MYLGEVNQPRRRPHLDMNMPAASEVATLAVRRRNHVLFVDRTMMPIDLFEEIKGELKLVCSASHAMNGQDTLVLHFESSMQAVEARDQALDIIDAHNYAAAHIAAA